MSTVYSLQLFAGNVPVGGGVLATPPAGYVWVLRDIELWIPNPVSSLLYIGVEWSPGSIVPLIAFSSGAAGVEHQWMGNTVVPYGQSLYGSAPSSGNGVLVSGYQLTLP